MIWDKREVEARKYMNIWDSERDCRQSSHGDGGNSHQKKGLEAAL
jgi:hypothetical protein